MSAKKAMAFHIRKLAVASSLHGLGDDDPRAARQHEHLARLPTGLDKPVVHLGHRIDDRTVDDEVLPRVQRVDRPLIPVVAQMERHGIKVDRERLAGLSSTFAEQIGGLETVIHGLAGEVFTIGSPKQLGDILFDKMGFKGGKKGDDLKISWVDNKGAGDTTTAKIQ